MANAGRQGKALPLSLLAIVVVLALANVVVSQSNRDGSQSPIDSAAGSQSTAASTPESNSASTGGPSGPAATMPQIPCDQIGTVRLDLTVSTEKAELLDQFANRYNQARRLADGRCINVVVSRVTSGQAQQSLAGGWEATNPERVPEPQAWAPTSSIWVSFLELEWAEQNTTPVDRNGGRILDDLGSMAQSPLTIAMREPMAEALGWPDQPIGWGDVLSLIDAPDGWGSVGHPEWGPFTLGKDNPRRSTSGMAATVAAFYAGAGSPNEITLENVGDADTREFVAGVEQGMLRYSDEATKFLERMLAAEADLSDNDQPFISAALIQEQLVYLYNTGNPKGQSSLVASGGGDRPRWPLVAISPVDGTLMMDHPFIVLPSASSDQRQAAEGFHRFILEPAQQAELATWGFRGADGVAGQQLVEQNVVRNTARPSVVANPTAEVVKGVLDAWDVLRKKVRLLIVYDVSGSMATEFRDSETGRVATRNQLAKEAAAAGLDQLSPDDEVGIWLFSDESRWGSLPYIEWTAPTAIRTGEQQLKNDIEDIVTGGDTALYRTVLAATRHIRDNYDRELINTILVLSDGKNDDVNDGNDPARLENLIADLQTEAAGEPIRVFAIAFDRESDLPTLTRIAEATGGAGYDARQANTIRDVFVDVISNF